METYVRGNEMEQVSRKLQKLQWRHDALRFCERYDDSASCTRFGGTQLIFEGEDERRLMSFGEYYGKMLEVREQCGV